MLNPFSGRAYTRCNNVFGNRGQEATDDMDSVDDRKAGFRLAKWLPTGVLILLCVGILIAVIVVLINRTPPA